MPANGDKVRPPADRRVVVDFETVVGIEEALRAGVAARHEPRPRIAGIADVTHKDRRCRTARRTRLVHVEIGADQLVRDPAEDRRPADPAAPLSGRGREKGGGEAVIPSDRTRRRERVADPAVGIIERALEQTCLAHGSAEFREQVTASSSGRVRAVRSRIDAVALQNVDEAVRTIDRDADVRSRADRRPRKWRRAPVQLAGDEKVQPVPDDGTGERAPKLVGIKIGNVMARGIDTHECLVLVERKHRSVECVAARARNRVDLAALKAPLAHVIRRHQDIEFLDGIERQ